MNPEDLIKKLEPYLSNDKVLRGDMVLREIVRTVPPELFETARELGMITKSGKMDGDYSVFSNPDGHFMRWYVIV